jgi:hypothetical protein
MQNKTWTQNVWAFKLYVQPNSLSKSMSNNIYEKYVIFYTQRPTSLISKCYVWEFFVIKYKKTIVNNKKNKIK